MSSEDIAIAVENLSKRYEIYATPRDRLKQLVLPKLDSVFQSLTGSPQKPGCPRKYFKEFWALQGLTFDVRKGETLGIVGRNGSGKSTLLQIIAGTLSPTAGQVSVKGRVAALLELGSGFNPEFTGKENVYLNGQILGFSQSEIDDRYADIVEFADIGEFIEQPVKTYSSGMFLRLAFAVQAHVDASVVIIDEALTVGDVFFRQKCYSRLEQLRRQGAAILLVSHSMPDIEQYCDRAIVLDSGRIRYMGAPGEAAKHYYLLHQPARVSGSPAADPGPMSGGEPRVDMATFLPPPEARIDITGKVQIGTGQARCTGVAICDRQGRPCNVFQQGEAAVFYYEFTIDDDIEIPICGLIICNERGVIVFGKNNWQYDAEPSRTARAGYRVLCRQEVTLDLGVGEYTLEVGLASVSAGDWARRQYISHEESEILHHRICHLSGVAAFSVRFADRHGVPVLTHHGLVNLPGMMQIEVAR